MYISYPSQAQYFDVLGLRPIEYAQPLQQPPVYLHHETPSSFHHKALGAGQQYSTEPVLAHCEKQAVSVRSIREIGKSYYCSFEWCGKKFQSINARRVHERSVHLNEKPFQCQICLKKFAHKSDAKKHLHVHSGVKPYICLTCKKSFSQSSNLFTHIRKQHKIAPKQQENWIKNWLA